MKDFNSFKARCISILSESDNCIESQKIFHAAKDYSDLVMAWQRFWAGVLREVPNQVMKAFDELYEEYKTDLNAAGMYYNEAPANTNGVTVLMGNKEDDIDFYGRVRVYVIGECILRAWDNVAVHCNNKKAQIILFDNAHAIMEGGDCDAYGRSLINGFGTFKSYDSATVYITGGKLEDHGHMNIEGYNDAVIKSFTHKNITIKDNAKLIINE